MLVKPPMEQLLPKTENRYTLAILAAKRTRQLVAGAQPMTTSDSPNLVTLACEEIADGQVVEVHNLVEPILPLRPEIEEANRSRQAEEDAEANLDTLRGTLVAMQAKPEAAQAAAPRSMIKILDANNEVVDARTYFQDDEDDEIQVETDLFASEAEPGDEADEADEAVDVLALTDLDADLDTDLDADLDVAAPVDGYLDDAVGEEER